MFILGHTRFDHRLNRPPILLSRFVEDIIKDFVDIEFGDKEKVMADVVVSVVSKVHGSHDTSVFVALLGTEVIIEGQLAHDIETEMPRLFCHVDRRGIMRDLQDVSQIHVDLLHDGGFEFSHRTVRNCLPDDPSLCTMHVIVEGSKNIYNIVLRCRQVRVRLGNLVVVIDIWCSQRPCPTTGFGLGVRKTHLAKPSQC